MAEACDVALDASVHVISKLELFNFDARRAHWKSSILIVNHSA
jgi:hypothetical protein